MSALLDLYLNQFLVFVLVLSRVGGLIATAPIFGSRSVPLQIRVLLAITLSMLITPLHWNTEIEYPGNVINLLVFIGSEVVVGLTLGLGVMILFTGIQMAGEIIGQMSGSRLADTFNPTFNESVAIYSQLIDVLTLSVFLIIGGHRQVMDALLETFRWMPPGSGGVSSGVLETIIDLVTQSFILGIRAAAPATVALLLSLVIMGLISRTLPQLNILAVGFSLNSILTLAVLAFSLGTMAFLFQEEVGPTLDAIRQTFQRGLMS